MQSSEPILSSDYPFRETFWPQFIEKRHPAFGNRAFQSPIACLAPIPCPEMATFSNDAGQFSGTRGQVAGWGYRQERTGRITRDPEVWEGDLR
jgi:hypothetical protein